MNHLILTPLPIGLTKRLVGLSLSVSANSVTPNMVEETFSLHSEPSSLGTRQEADSIILNDSRSCHYEAFLPNYICTTTSMIVIKSYRIDPLHSSLLLFERVTSQNLSKSRSVPFLNRVSVQLSLSII